MKKILTVLIFLVSVQTQAQITKKRNGVWLLPSINTKINGLAAGLSIISLKDKDIQPVTIVNGLSLELIGLGLVMPMAGDPPLYREDDKSLDDKAYLDSLIKADSSNWYLINGISISPGGLAGDVTVKGLSLSGLYTLTAKVNGISICGIANHSAILNGVSVAGLYNKSLQTKGLQIGLVNKTKRLKGFQIGLWNRNEKREIPFVNWNFN